MADMGAQLAPRVAVIGGGCAGLASAVALTRAGINTTVFESSHQLGGRARGFNWQGTMLDNGQHILLGAYAHTLDLLHTCGVDADTGLLRLPLKLEMRSEFLLDSQSFLPAPLHLLSGLLRAQGLSAKERLAAISFMAGLRIRQFRLPVDITLQQLLAKQPPRLVTMLWEPLCLAALNTPLATASAQAFLNVLRDSFAHAKSDSDLLLPRVDLSALIAEPAAKFIQTHGGEVKRNDGIENIDIFNNELRVKSKAQYHKFTHLIIATSPFRVAALLQQLPDMKNTVTACEALQYQPIYTVYLQYPAETQLPSSMCGLTGCLGQWVFDRGQLYGQAGLLAVVISAEGGHQKLTQGELAIAVHQELQNIFPILQTTEPIWHKVVAEKRATFACTAGLQRPVQATRNSRIWLAGDYVSTSDALQDYPGTIEGAIRSGFQVAKNIIKSL